MASLDAYIAQLQYLEQNLPKIVGNIAKENEESILDLNRRRLLNTGIDAKGGLIGGGVYALLTVGLKELKNQETGHFTLFDTGDFHESMFLQIEGDKLFFRARDRKTPILIAEYGPNILGLNEQETVYIQRWIIQPGIDKLLGELPQIIDP